MARAAHRLIVTTSTKPTPDLAARARTVADRCDVEVRSRRGSLPSMLAAADADAAYVVGRDRESLASRTGRVSTDVGLLHAHRSVGRQHPLLRALGDARRVVDATLGLCHDALHVAEVLGADVVGIEASPALFSLAEAGLVRLAAEGVEAARRIRPILGDARAVLGDLDADVVMLSPMFDEPRAAAPGFDVLRVVATDGALDEAWLTAALGAAPRAVLKARRAQPVPSFAGRRLQQIIQGKSVDYWVLG